MKSDSPFKSLKDLLEFAKKNPGKLTYGHPGVGTRSHLIMEMIAAHEDIKMNFVAFAGDAPEVAAILGGHVMAGGGLRRHYLDLTDPSWRAKVPCR